MIPWQAGDAYYSLRLFFRVDPREQTSFVSSHISAPFRFTWIGYRTIISAATDQGHWFCQEKSKHTSHMLKNTLASQNVFLQNFWKFWTNLQPIIRKLRAKFRVNSPVFETLAIKDSSSTRNLMGAGKKFTFHDIRWTFFDRFFALEQKGAHEKNQECGQFDYPLSGSWNNFPESLWVFTKNKIISHVMSEFLKMKGRGSFREWLWRDHYLNNFVKYVECSVGATIYWDWKKNDLVDSIDSFFQSNKMNDPLRLNGFSNDRNIWRITRSSSKFD